MGGGSESFAREADAAPSVELVRGERAVGVHVMKERLYPVAPAERLTPVRDFTPLVDEHVAGAERDRALPPATLKPERPRLRRVEPYRERGADFAGVAVFVSGEHRARLVNPQVRVGG